MWHGGGLDQSRSDAWLPALDRLTAGTRIGPDRKASIWPPEDIQCDGPARVLLGNHGIASSAIACPSLINYLAVRLKAGERLAL